MTDIRYINPGNVLVTIGDMHETGTRLMALLEHQGMPIRHICVEDTTFANGELMPFIPKSVRGEHVFLLAPLQFPDPNTALIELELTLQALELASVSGITVVIPYHSYTRQDRKAKARVPISAKHVAKKIQSFRSVRHVITLDLHAEQEVGFYDIPVDNISPANVIADDIKAAFSGELNKLMFVSPDLGGMVRMRRIAKKVGSLIPKGTIDKEHLEDENNKTRVLGYIGPSVKGFHVIMPDDIIDTGGTILNAALEVLRMGALSVTIYGTHAVMSKDAEDRLGKAGVKVVVTQSIPRPAEYWEANKAWLSVVSIDELLANAIHESAIVGGSVSKLST